MQDRYAGDIGDYIKLALLRQLAPGRRLGVMWWLYPNEAHNADGKHVSYLSDPSKWRTHDPELFDGLHRLVTRVDRSVAALEAAGFIAGAVYHNRVIPLIGGSADRRQARAAWFAEAKAAVANCDLIFLDPDNGLETADFDAGRSKSGKSVALTELAALRQPGRSIVVYHHQTRMAGGHVFELSHWGKRLAELGFAVDALRASAFSARAFFLLDASSDLRDRAATMATSWGEKLRWHPRLS